MLALNLMEAEDTSPSNAQHQAADVTDAWGESHDEHGQNDEQAEMLLPLFDSHLNEEPYDQANQGRFHERK